MRASEDLEIITAIVPAPEAQEHQHPPEVIANIDHQAKILESECVVSVLVRMGSVYQEVHFELPCCLQVIDKCSGETYLASHQQSRPFLEDLITKFNRSDRHAMIDSDGAVLRSERALSNTAPHRLLNHMLCRVHRIAKIATKGADAMLKDDVSSAIHIALTLQSAGAMRVFRRCLRKVICERVRVCRGSPSFAADLHRRKVLDLFVPIKPGVHASFVRRAIVEVCANGDYSSDRFEIYLDGEYNLADVLHLLCTHFAMQWPPMPTLEKPGFSSCSGSGALNG